MEQAREAIQRRKALDFELTRQKEFTTPALASVYHSRGAQHAPMLLIDGYNVLFKHAKLKRLLVHGRLEDARDKLHEIVRDFAAAAEAQVTVVWDALRVPEDHLGAGLDRVQELPDLTVVWAGASEADNYIVRAVRRLIVLGAEYVLVVTDDAEERMFARNEGAYTLHAAELMRQATLMRKEGRVSLMAQSAAEAVSTGNGIRMHVDTDDVAKALQLQAFQLNFECVEDMQEAAAMGADADSFYRERMQRQNRRQELEERASEAGVATTHHDRRVTNGRHQQEWDGGLVGTPVVPGELAELLHMYAEE
jgi:predicted RNA-binding protein with PIN domain